MYRNLLGKPTIALIALSGLAVAGDVRLGDSLAIAGLRIASGVELTCSQVDCSDASLRPQFTSISDGRTVSPATMPQTTDFSAIMSLGVGLSRLAAHLTGARTNPSTDSNSVPSDTFILSGNRVTESFDSSAGAVSQVPADFSDPIVSPAYNVYSTSLASAEMMSASQLSIASPLSVVIADAVKTPAADTQSSSAQPKTVSLQTPSSDATSTGTVSFARMLESTPYSADAVLTAGTMSAPEPATDLLIGAGLIAAGVFARLKRRNRE